MYRRHRTHSQSEGTDSCIVNSRRITGGCREVMNMGASTPDNTLLTIYRFIDLAPTPLAVECWVVVAKPTEVERREWWMTTHLRRVLFDRVEFIGAWTDLSSSKHVSAHRPQAFFVVGSKNGYQRHFKLCTAPQILILSHIHLYRYKILAHFQKPYIFSESWQQDLRPSWCRRAFHVPARWGLPGLSNLGTP